MTTRYAATRADLEMILGDPRRVDRDRGAHEAARMALKTARAQVADTAGVESTAAVLHLPAGRPAPKLEAGSVHS